MDLTQISDIIRSIDLAPMAVSVVSKFPYISGVLMVVGASRAIMKPLFSLLRTIVDQTETKKDNEVLDQVEQSKVYKAFIFVTDYLLSIKLK